jgi:hypothetical protein
MMPAGVFPHFILVHTQFGLGFLKALFNGPAHATQPDKQGQSGTHRRIAQDHAERAWKTLLALLYKGQESTLVFTDPVFGQTVVDVWQSWPKTYWEFTHTEGHAIEWSLKKPFLLAFQRNWERRDKLTGPITLVGRPLDWTREAHTYTVTGSVIEQTSVETRALPSDPQPGERPIAELLKEEPYKSMFERLGKGPEGYDPGRDNYLKNYGRGSGRYAANDPAVPGGENQPPGRLRVVELPGDPHPADGADAGAVPAEPDGGGAAARDLEFLPAPFPLFPVAKGDTPYPGRAQLQRCEGCDAEACDGHRDGDDTL